MRPTKLVVVLVVCLSCSWDAFGKLTPPTTVRPRRADLPYPLSYVDPLIGTYGEGYGVGSTPPGPQVPFGMVRLSPDTVWYDNIFIEWNHFGGYYYGDSYIRVFSHTHMCGAGILDYGNIGVLPISTDPTSALVTDYGFRSYFDHRNEEVQVGYYSVLLEDWNIFCELTATKRVGVHRYTYLSEPDSDGKRVVLFDVSHALQKSSGASTQINPQSGEVTGWVIDDGSFASRCGGVRVFFVARFVAAGSLITNFTSNFGVWNSGVLSSQTNISGTDIGAWVEFESSITGNYVVEVYVGLSFVSIENARLNLMTETNNLTLRFDDIQQQTQKLWLDQIFSLIQVNATGRPNSTDTENDLTKFYTALYHTNVAPTCYSDVNGQYLGFDNKIHVLPPQQECFYSDMSIWDVFRSEFPLLVILHPSTVMPDILRSLVLIYQQGGDLPRWPFANCYTNGMIGTHSNIIIADAYLKGIREFNVNVAYQAMVQSATQPQHHAGRTDLADWISKGYIPYDKSSVGCCQTLAYAYDDWAIGNLAAALGNDSDAALFHNRSENYKNVWSSSDQYFCPRNSDGSFSCPYVTIDPFDSRYVEGDAEQYRWFVPQHPQGLISLFSGGTEAFVQDLFDFFSLSLLDPYNILPNPYYWAGNEPDIFAGWLFDWAGRPDLTQEWTRKIMDTRYSVEPDGLPGNDDYGTLSAWYLLGALGFYPQSGNPIYALGSPVFPKVTIQIPGRPTVVIYAYGASEQRVYVQRAQLNGQPWSAPLIPHDTLFQNQSTVLEFWMGSSPSKWGRKGVVF